MTQILQKKEKLKFIKLVVAQIRLGESMLSPIYLAGRHWHVTCITQLVAFAMLGHFTTRCRHVAWIVQLAAHAMLRHFVGWHSYVAWIVQLAALAMHGHLVGWRRQDTDISYAWHGQILVNTGKHPHFQLVDTPTFS